MGLLNHDEVSVLMKNWTLGEDGMGNGLTHVFWLSGTDPPTRLSVRMAWLCAVDKVFGDLRGFKTSFHKNSDFPYLLFASTLNRDLETHVF